jgi:chromosome segregation ATPase
VTVANHTAVLAKIADWLGPQNCGYLAKDLLGEASTLLLKDQMCFREYFENLNRVVENNIGLLFAKQKLEAEIADVRKRNLELAKLTERPTQLEEQNARLITENAELQARVAKLSEPAVADLADLENANKVLRQTLETQQAERDKAIKRAEMANTDANNLSRELSSTKDKLKAEEGLRLHEHTRAENAWMKIKQQETELAQLRHEIDVLKGQLAGVRDDLVMSRDRSASLQVECNDRLVERNEARERSASLQVQCNNLNETLDGSDKVTTDALRRCHEAHQRLADCARARDQFEQQWREAIDENYRKSKTIAQLEEVADVRERRIKSLKADIDNLLTTTTLVTRDHHNKTVADLEAKIADLSQQVIAREKDIASHTNDCERWADELEKLRYDMLG